MRGFINRGDSWWAQTEVNEGLDGWNYDMCCNKEASLQDQREQLHNLGYCDKDECEYRRGADFCIVSPRYACREVNSGRVIFTSNQCCYDSSGSIIRSDDLDGAGSMNIQLSSMSNMIPHYQADIRPYIACGLVPPPTTGYGIFRKHRPNIVGRYFPPLVLQGRCDPHLQTADGISYSFMGIGVYTLIEASGADPFQLQASMRKFGNGTIFSGFATNCQNTILEAYLDHSGEFSFAINGLEVEEIPVDYFIIDNIEITRNEDRSAYKFKFMTVNLIVQAVITENVLNLFISPPLQLRGFMNGLLGLYDGNSTNDLTSSGKSNCIYFKVYHKIIQNATRQMHTYF